MSYSKSHTELGYRADIDGLRALAVIPVVLFHAHFGFPGGFVGVDIFFVISGFLITSIISKKLQTNSFTLKEFWLRRIQRILPASTLVTLVTLVVGYMLLLPDQLEDLGKASLAHTFMNANTYFWQQDGYFAGPSEFAPLLHMWSLSLEEQFYLIFPFLLLFLHSRNSKTPSPTNKVLTILCVASLAWSCFAVYHYTASAFYLLPSRAWELLLGALIALVPNLQFKSRRSNEIGSILGLGLILLSFSFLNSNTPFPGAASIAPCVGAALLIFTNKREKTLIGKVLSLKPFTFTGKISYSLYLWHWPIIVYANHLSPGKPTLELRISAILISFILAYLSWKFVENPFRSKRFSINPKRTYQLATCAIAALAIIGGSFYFSKGLPARLDSVNQIYAAAAAERSPLKNTPDLSDLEALPTLLPAKDEPTISPILLWGDSHAKVLATPLSTICKREKTNIYIAVRAGHPPLLGVSRYPREKGIAEYNAEIIQFIKKHKISTVILGARWSFYGNGQQLGIAKSILMDENRSDTPQEEVFKKQFNHTIETLKSLGVKVWIVKEAPYHHRRPPELLIHGRRLGWDINKSSTSLTAHHARQEFVDSVINKVSSTNIQILDPIAYFSSPGGFCAIEKDGRPLYRDEDHLSFFGASHTQPLLEVIFSSNSQ